MIIQDAYYKAVDKIAVNDDYIGLSIDNANHIIDEISDNMYVLRNKIEDLNRIGESLGIYDISEYTESLNNEIANLFDSYLWQNILRKFQEVNESSDI